MKIGTIFVYGSLMKDFFNYNKYLKGKVIEIKYGYVIGSLYHLSNKGYPGFMKSGHGKIYGEIMTIRDYDEVLVLMDKLEGYVPMKHVDNMYNRISTQVFELASTNTHMLDVYVYNDKAKVNKRDIKIPLDHGSWRDYMMSLEPLILKRQPQRTAR